MENKDIISISISIIALASSILAIYLSHWHKTSKAILCLNDRLFDCLNGNMIRDLSYTLSNTGNQELFVKDVSLLLGQSPLGNLRDSSSFLVIPTNRIEPFVIKPGEIRTFSLSHDVNFKLPPDYNTELNKYMIVSLEIISATGSRYQMTHDITKLGPSGPDIKDEIWKGIPLGCKI
ncbi:hypothetical protein [Plesiomonas shigelloides]|uniref:hypothetical protein n=1 Tax=Plesiomonas shigelloides TaxID=703 RepID=UPI000A111450|nr:hypothetical protein [Plesiomonas shigelloides]